MEPSDLLRYVAETLERIGADYLVTGSTVTIAFGEPRFTNDVDIIVDLKPQQVAEFCRSFPNKEFYVNEQAVRDAVENKRQFNVIHPSSGMKVDFFIRQDSQFDDSRFARVKRVAATADFHVCFASLEDVIVKKMEYYREGVRKSICGTSAVCCGSVESRSIPHTLKNGPAGWVSTQSGGQS